MDYYEQVHFIYNVLVLGDVVLRMRPITLIYSTADCRPVAGVVRNISVARYSEI